MSNKKFYAKDCPFCGAEPIIKPAYQAGAEGEHHYNAFVKCSHYDCSAYQTAQVYSKHSLWTQEEIDNATNRAVSKWNERRYTEDTPEELDLFKIIVRLEETLHPFNDTLIVLVRDMWKIYINKDTYEKLR